MNFTEQQAGKYVLIELSGDITGSEEARCFQAVLDSHIAEGRMYIGIDYGKARTLSSDFINVIMSVHIAVKKRGGELVLMGHNPVIDEVFDIIGVPLIVSMFADRKSFEAQRNT